MAIILDTNQQTADLPGGFYNITAFLNSGAASLEVQKNDSSNWSDIGTLEDAKEMIVKLPVPCTVRITKTGAAVIELSR